MELQSMLRLIKLNPRYHGEFLTRSLAIMLEDLSFKHDIKTLYGLSLNIEINLENKFVHIVYDHNNPYHKFKILRSLLYNLKYLISLDKAYFFKLISNTELESILPLENNTQSVILYDGIVNPYKPILLDRLYVKTLKFNTKDINMRFSDFMYGVWKAVSHNDDLAGKTIIKYKHTDMYQMYFENYTLSKIGNIDNYGDKNLYGEKYKRIYVDEISLYMFSSICFYLDISCVGQFILDPLIFRHGYSTQLYYNNIQKIDMNYIGFILRLDPFLSGYQNKWRFCLDRTLTLYFIEDYTNPKFIPITHINVVVPKKMNDIDGNKSNEKIYVETLELFSAQSNDELILIKKLNINHMKIVLSDYSSSL